MPTLAIVPFITAAMAAIKVAGLPKKFVPLTSAFLGCAVGIALNGQTVFSALEGIAAGLAAVGLYETGKHAVS